MNIAETESDSTCPLSSEDITAGLDDSSVPEPGISDSPPPSPGVAASTVSFPGTPLESNPASESSLPEPSNDIGNFVQATKSVAEICSTLNGLSNAKKYALMFRHVSPPLTLPRTFSHGCYRKFSTSWLEKYPWLRYSPVCDGVFCGACAIFLSRDKRRDKGLLVNKPFSNWVKISDTLRTHSKYSYHLDALQSADTVKMTIENPASRLDILASSTLRARITENKHILRQIVRAILFLAKQGMAFRGDVEDVSSNKNPGNFLALLAMLAENDSILHGHLHEPRARNVTYLSPRSQNEIINVIGYDLIRAKIISEVKEARFYSVLADEVSSHNVEHLPLCLRFVDSNSDIREEFVAFLRLERVRAVDIVDAIVGCLEGLGLSLNELRGQGYDGASTMSGEKSGVQKRIREIQPKALYTHCAGHSLNLAIVSSCSIMSIRNAIDHIKSLTLWIKASAKREGLLKMIYHSGTQSTSSRAPLLNVCITRWVENIDGWERFSSSHPFLVQMCEVILFGNSEYEMYNEGWAVEDKRNAQAHLNALMSFEIVYSLVTLQRSLLYLKEAVVKLQGPSQDIASGVALVSDCAAQIKALRDDVDNYAHRIFEHSCRIAERSEIPISMPRVSLRQQHRSNPPSTSVEEYFKLSVTIPFLDHIHSDLVTRFAAHVKQSATIQKLIPAHIKSDSSVDELKEAVAFYEEDLPNADLVDEEYHLWKSKWLSTPQQDRPRALGDCLKQCSPESLPNIYTLLKIFATLPLSSCSCERSASALRRLNNYLRCTQTEERLSALALIHCNYHQDLEVDSICKLFIEKYPRRIEFANMLFNN